MAIHFAQYKLLKQLRIAGELPLGKPILELGQANFYGDCDPREWLPDVDAFVSNAMHKAHLRATIKRLYGDIGRIGWCDPIAFGLARCAYEILFDTTDAPDAIDQHGYENFRNADLNAPIENLGSYGTVINQGTAEHIFNIGQVFRTMHDACMVNGLMIHESPLTGWVDHGFYCLQPTLFYDVARANGYKIVSIHIEHITSKTTLAVECQDHIHQLALADMLSYNAMLFVALRKTSESAFVIPQQGVYAGETDKETWLRMR